MGVTDTIRVQQLDAYRLHQRVEKLARIVCGFEPYVTYRLPPELARKGANHIHFIAEQFGASTYSFIDSDHYHVCVGRKDGRRYADRNPVLVERINECLSQLSAKLPSQ